MKKLFIGLIGLIAVIIAIPAAFFGLVYDTSGETDMPTYLYTADASAERMLYEELDAAITDYKNGVSDDFVYNLSEDIINVAIYEQVRKEFPEYMPGEDCETDACKYIFSDSVDLNGQAINYRLIGVWVDLSEDLVEFNVFMEIDAFGMNYSTMFEIEFVVKQIDVTGSDYDDYYLQFEKVRLGGIPFPRSAIAPVLENVLVNIEGEDDLDTESEFGEFSLKDLSFTFSQEEILDAIYDGEEEDTTVETTNEDGEEVEENAELTRAFASIVFTNDLLELEVIEDGITLTAGLRFFESTDITDSPESIKELQDVDGNYDPTTIDVDTYMEGIIQEYVFNLALVNDSKLIFTEDDLNKIIYANLEGFESLNKEYEYEYEDESGAMVTKVISYGVESAWVEMNNEGIDFYFLFMLEDIPMVLQLTTSEQSSTDQEVVLEVTSVTFGKDAEEDPSDYINISEDNIDILVSAIKESNDLQFVEINDDNQFVITVEALTALLDDGSANDSITVETIEITDGQLELGCVATDANLQSTIDAYSDEIHNIILDADGVLDDDLAEVLLDEGSSETEQELYDAVQDLQTTLENEEEITGEDVAAMFELYSDLDEGTQNSFMGVFENLAAGAFEDFEEGFGNEETPE